ncbi:glycoside hydrolase family 38 N-terminal domain-containing protein [Aestuariivivens insulae]|uniref:glycoside hydrolase family 38 N-terminal domain-containing protein n=1 Tax=Aestuariivivens insulae TaxID=1621988 RepID=UPI001F574D8B|nr:glycosyl hydrolase-related protein [Aestuariivivens insulae]
MKKVIIFFIPFILLGPIMVMAQSTGTVKFEYPRPYEYVFSDNRIMVKGQLSDDSGVRYREIAFSDGNRAKIEQQNGKSWVWLPVMGEPEMIQIIANGKTNSKTQLFTPLVTSDWGYFEEGTFHIISSSHQDIAWMDTPQACRHDRIYEIIGPALDIMKKDKVYHFGMEQALNLKEFIEEHPDRKQEVIQRYKEGRFVYGATYNQPYEGMQMGEQLIREMYFGKLWIEKNFDGIQENTAYNTDVPGRTLQFPQILAKSGTENLFVSRMREGFYDWHSPDGSSVLTYTPGNYGWAAMFYKIFDDDAIEALRKIQNRVKMWSDYYRQHNLPPHFAIVISNDASGPVDYGKVVKEWNEIRKNSKVKIPELRHSTVPGFLENIKEGNPQFENLEGDRPNIWAYIHGPGHHKAITASRASGRMLPSAEIFNTVDALLNSNFENYPEARLTKAFEESIYPDHGWGGLNGHITDSIFRAKLEFAASEANEMFESSINSIATKINTKRNDAVVVFNDLSWKRNGIATASVPSNAKGYYLVDEKGDIVPSQPSLTDPKLLQFYASEVPSLGYKTYYLKKGKKSIKLDAQVSPNALTNSYYTLHLGVGGITYLFDHDLGKEILNTTRFSGGDVLSMGYDGNGAGEFTQMTEPNMVDYDQLSNHDSHWKIVENGVVFSEFENRAKFKHTEVVQKIRVYHQEKKIDFYIDLLNWDGTHNREFRFAVPLDMDNARIKYEVPLAIAEVGKTEMKQAPGGWAWGGTYDQKPETIHPREVLNFISAETDDFAVTLATDVALADWIDPTREAVDYTVLQGILMASHKSCHGEGNWYHQTGDHHFKFSISSHKPSTTESYQFGTASNHMFKTVFDPSRNSSEPLPETHSFFSVSDPMVRISTVKKSEEGSDVIVRLVEMEGKDKSPTVKVPVPFDKLIHTNLIEKEKMKMENGGQDLNINIGHNAIETYKLIFPKPGDVNQ